MMFNERLNALTADDDLPPNMLKTIEAAVHEQAKEGYNVNEEDFAAAAELEGNKKKPEGPNDEKKQDELNSRAAPLESQSQKPGERVEAASGAETAEQPVDNTAANAKAGMPQNDSVDKTSKNYLADKGKSSANAARPDPEMKKNRRQQQPCRLQSPPPKMRIKKQKARLASHKRRPQIKALLFSAGSPAKEQNKNPQSPRAEAKEGTKRNQARQKGQREQSKNTRGFSGCPVLPKGRQRSGQNNAAIRRGPAKFKHCAEPAAPTSKRKAKAAAAAPLVSKGKTQPAAKGDAKKRQRK